MSSSGTYLAPLSPRKSSILTPRYLKRMFINSDLSNLKQFSDEVENFLSIQLEHHDKLAKELVAAHKSAEGENAQMMIFTGGLQTYGSDFPHILRNSLFVYMFSKWEGALESFCKHIRKERKLKLGQKDLNGDVLERSKLYLEKVAGLRFPKTPKTIQSLRVLGFIRNLIVHSNGVMPDSYDAGRSRAIVSYLKKTKTGCIINDIGIHLDDAFCPAAIGVFESFWRELFYSSK